MAETRRPGAGPQDGRPRASGWTATREAARANAVAWFLGILVALAVVWTLRQTVWVSLPLAFAFFIALGVWPICHWVQEHVPHGLRWLGYVAAMAVIVVFLGLFFGGIWYVAERVATEFPKYSEQFSGLWQSATAWVGDLRVTGGETDGQQGGEAAAGPAGDGEGEQDEFGVDGLLDPITNLALSVANSAWQTLAMIVLIFFFVLLMLIEAPVWREKLSSATSGSAEHAWVQAVRAIAQRFRWYLVVRTALGLITGVLYGAWVWLFGVDFVVLWGVLAFLLNFIPTIGSLIAGILPVLFAFVQKDVPTALLVGAGLLVIEQVMGNYVDPRLQGQQLSISALVVLLALMFWGWIWGIPGALIAVPMTVLVMTLFARIPALRPIALFLSDETDARGLRDTTRPN